MSASSFSLTNKLILDNVFYLRDPTPPPGQPDTAIAKCWNATHRQFSARVVGGFTSATAAVDLVIQLGIALGKGSYVTLSYITFHKIPYSNRWNFTIVALDFVKVGQHAKLVAIGSIMGIFAPDSLEILAGRQTWNSDSDDTEKPSVSDLCKISSQEVKNLFSTTVENDVVNDKSIAAYKKFTAQQKVNFHRLMNAYDNPLQRRGFTKLTPSLNSDLDLTNRMRSVRAKWAPHLFSTPENVYQKRNGRYSKSSSEASWYAPHELTNAINAKVKKSVEDRGTVEKIAGSFYFHCTEEEDVVKLILESRMIRVEAGTKFPGAFVSTEPEFYGYGKYCFCFNQSVGFMSEASIDVDSRRTWLGFSKPIPINPETLNCIIYDDSNYTPSDDFESEVNNWAKFNIKVIPLSKAEPILDAARSLQRGLSHAAETLPKPRRNYLADNTPRSCISLVNIYQDYR